MDVLFLPGILIGNKPLMTKLATVYIGHTVKIV